MFTSWRGKLEVVELPLAEMQTVEKQACGGSVRATASGQQDSPTSALTGTCTLSRALFNHSEEACTSPHDSGHHYIRTTWDTC